VSSDKANGVYTYEITGVDFGDPLSCYIYVASKNANLGIGYRTPIQPNQYTAFFNYNDGTGKTSTTAINYGEKMTAPSEPTRTGYVFDGWINAAGRLYDFSQNVTGDVNLTARWVKGYTVTFAPANGKASFERTVESGDVVSKPSTPVRSGYEFLGWYTSSGAKYDFSSAVSSDFTLTAKWKKQTKTSVTKCKFSGPSNRTYTGKAQKPAVTVKYGTKKLTKNKDYTLSYSNNKKVGVAKVIVRGKGNYTGSKTLKFTIFPKATSLTSVAAAGSGRMTVKWKKAAGAAGYEVYRSTTKSGGYSRIKAVYAPATGITDKGLKSGKTYYYRVKVVQKSGTVYYASKYSAAKSAKAK
jgi:uncharacterized repeat protein (TIGR02543 family)